MGATSRRSPDPGLTMEPDGPRAGDLILGEWLGAYGVQYPELFLVEARPDTDGSRLRSLGLCELMVITPTGVVVRDEFSDGFQVQLLEFDVPWTSGLVTVWLDRGFPAEQVKITGQVRHRGAINIHGSDATDFLLWMRRRAATLAEEYIKKARQKKGKEQDGSQK